MKSTEIKVLLQKYFDGLTSEEEEKILSEYFSGDEMDNDLLQYQEFFTAKEELSNSVYTGFEDEIMDHILETEHADKNKYRWLWQAVTSVAAVLIIAFVSVNYLQDRSTLKDTYEDPEIAYMEASKAIRYVAGKYQKGLAQLHPISKIDKAPNSMKSGLGLVNKGFEEMGELPEVNKKIKKE